MLYLTSLNLIDFRPSKAEVYVTDIQYQWYWIQQGWIRLSDIGFNEAESNITDIGFNEGGSFINNIRFIRTKSDITDIESNKAGSVIS